MARTLTVIYDSLVTEMGSYSSLDGLTGTGGPVYAADVISAVDSQSRVGIWSLYLWIVAFATWTVEKLFDNHTTEVTARAAATIAGNNAWLVQQVQLFELNNGTLTVSTDRKVVYATSNVANRIVMFASVAREYGRAVIKVAKADGDGLPTPLSSPEVTQLATYVNHIQFAGTKLAVVSRAADRFKVSGQIYYNGLLDPTGVQTDINAAVSSFLAAVPFDGSISLEKVTDAIQKVTGVSDLVVQFYGKPATSGSYGSALSGPIWNPYAGFAVLDTTDLTFIPS